MSDFAVAATLLAIDPGLGAMLRGPPGPVREAWLASLRRLLPVGTPWRRIPLHVTDDRLLGGIDLAATLASGHRRSERGLLAEADGGVVLVAMAERMDLGIAARIGGVMDTGQVMLERDGLTECRATRFGVVALDEGQDERPPAGLSDRLAMLIEVPDDAPGILPEIDIAVARACLPGIAMPAEVTESLCAAALALGIASLRAPILALRAARAASALAGRDRVTDEDATLAARLVLGPRATQLPQAPDPPPPDAPPDPPAEGEEATPPQEEMTGQMADLVLEAARAAIPPRLLAQLAIAAATGRARSAGKSGAPQKAATRGRVIGSRPGDPRAGARLDLLATLRAAAPWQKLRHRTASPARVAIRRDDFRIRRFRQTARTTSIFVVDASGSAALARLAEAKGAVETLLAECYIRRDRVALIAVRGPGAELLLPPTSSLARAKKCLAALPGGGGTPLATGIEAAMGLADAVRRSGQTPILVFFTDGRANLARDGKPGREAATRDALAAARAVRDMRLTALLIDSASKPQPAARALADAMGATYLPLPYARPNAISQAVREAAA